MNDLSIKVTQTPGVIKFDNTEIKEALERQMKVYESLEITEDNITESKADLATLRKIKEAFEKERKRVKADYKKPLDEFEAQCKEVTAIIDRPIKMIDEKLKGFEATRKEEKRKHIQEVYEAAIGEYKEFLPLSKVYREKWENKTSTDRDIQTDLSEEITLVKADLNAIAALNSEIHEQLVETYKENGNDLARAIQKHTDYMSAKAMAEKKVREEVREEIKQEIPIVETVEQDLAVANEEVVSFVISGKENIEKARMILNLEDIPYKEI